MVDRFISFDIWQSGYLPASKVYTATESLQFAGFPLIRGKSLSIGIFSSLPKLFLQIMFSFVWAGLVEAFGVAILGEVCLARKVGPWFVFTFISCKFSPTELYISWYVALYSFSFHLGPKISWQFSQVWVICHMIFPACWSFFPMTRTRKRSTGLKKRP